MEFGVLISILEIGHAVVTELTLLPSAEEWWGLPGPHPRSRGGRLVLRGALGQLEQNVSGSCSLCWWPHQRLSARSQQGFRLAVGPRGRVLGHRGLVAQGPMASCTRAETRLCGFV